MRNDDDKQLLGRWQGGLAAAGAELFDRHYEGLARFFCNKVDDADRDDLVQQTFLAAQTAVYDGRASVKTWLFSIAWRRMMDHFRKLARRGRRELPGLDDLSVLDLGASPESEAALGQQRRLLLEGLRRLPLKQQVVLELFYWEDLTASEVAAIVGAPVGTVKTRLRDGRLRLTKILGEIATDPRSLKTTLDDLDAWAQRVRVALGDGP